jgi:hypothetical protein
VTARETLRQTLATLDPTRAHLRSRAPAGVGARRRLDAGVDRRRRRVARRNLESTLVLETLWTCRSGQVRVLDLFSMRPGGDPHEQLVRIVEAVDGDAEMAHDGWLVRRYASADGLDGNEGASLPCTFWLSECLARQERLDEARTVFACAEALASDLPLRRGVRLRARRDARQLPAGVVPLLTHQRRRGPGVHALESTLTPTRTSPSGAS